MRLGHIIDKLETVRSVIDNGYYSERSSDFKLGIIMEKLESLCDEINEAIEIKEKLHALWEGENDTSSSDT